MACLKRNSRRLVERRPVAFEHDLPCPQSLEGALHTGVGRRAGRGQSVDGPVPEHPPDDRRLLEHVSLRWRERVDPRLEHALERRRHTGDVEALFVDVPHVAVDGDDVGLEEERHELLDVEGVALCRPDDEVHHGGRHLVDPLEDLAAAAAGSPGATSGSSVWRTW